MFRSKPLNFLVAVILLSSFAFAADEYQIDPVHSSATFTVRHMVISNVAGRFGNVTGTIVYDDKNPQNSSVNAVIKTATVKIETTTFLPMARSPFVHCLSAPTIPSGAYTMVPM